LDRGDVNSVVGLEEAVELLRLVTGGLVAGGALC
jgi:hypothetical protein